MYFFVQRRNIVCIELHSNKASRKQFTSTLKRIIVFANDSSCLSDAKLRGRDRRAVFDRIELPDVQIVRGTCHVAELEVERLEPVSFATTIAAISRSIIHRCCRRCQPMMLNQMLLLTAIVSAAVAIAVVVLRVAVRAVFGRRRRSRTMQQNRLRRLVDRLAGIGECRRRMHTC